MSVIDLDLDVIVKDPKRVKLGGEVIEIYPPDVTDLLDIGKQLLRFEKVQAGEGSGDRMKDATEMMDALRETIDKLAPNLKGKKLTIDQLYAIIGLIKGMAEPENTERRKVPAKSVGKKK